MRATRARDQLRVMCVLPGGSQGSVRVEVDVMDSFTVSFLMEDLLLDLQVPQTPRVVVTADKRVSTLCVCVVCWCSGRAEFTRLFPETSQKDARSLVTLVQCVPQYPPPARRYGNQGETTMNDPMRRFSSLVSPADLLPVEAPELHGSIGST